MSLHLLLPPKTDELLYVARNAAKNAYSPYSLIKVGCAISFVNRDKNTYCIFSGANVENASYGLTTCAERAAICCGVNSGWREIDKIVVSVQQKNAEIRNQLFPCGACLQIIAEFASKDTIVHVDGAGAFSIRDLLTCPFQVIKR